MADETDISALLSCPFCGGQAEMDTCRGYRNISTGKIGHAVAIYCLECSADFSFCREDMPDYTTEDLISLATETWNKRAHPADLEQARAEREAFATSLQSIAAYAPRGDLHFDAMISIARAALDERTQKIAIRPESGHRVRWQMTKIKLTGAKQRDDLKSLLEDHQNVTDALDRLKHATCSRTFTVSLDEGADFSDVPIHHAIAKRTLNEQRDWIEKELAKLGVSV